MKLVKVHQLARDGMLAPVSRWENIAMWQPRQQRQPNQQDDQQATQQNQAKDSPISDQAKEQRDMFQRIRQGQINACFIGIFALLGVALAFANAVPNQESAEVEALAILLVILLVPFGFNRAGSVTTASVLLALLPTIAVVATFTEPLPSGQSALTWTYDAGLAFASLGALIATLTLRPWVSWLVIIGGIILPLTLLIALMPHAASLVGLDLAGGIVSSHWSRLHQQLYVMYDFLFRPFLLIVLLGLVGARLRSLMFHR
jgi:hypothetical protein